MSKDVIPKGQYCEYGMVYGICCDEYPPFIIAKAQHEVSELKETNPTSYVCSYCLNSFFIDNEEREEGDDYELIYVNQKKLDEFDDKRQMRRAEYLSKAVKK